MTITYRIAKTYSDCLSGIVPAVITIALSNCYSEAGTFKQTDFVSKLKEMLKTNGWV